MVPESSLLKDGVIMQVDTPQNLYERAEQLVRSRIHRISADELPGCTVCKVEGDNAKPGPSQATAVPLPPAKVQEVGPTADTTARLLPIGIRPEDVGDSEIVHRGLSSGCCIRDSSTIKDYELLRCRGTVCTSNLTRSQAMTARGRFSEPLHVPGRPPSRSQSGCRRRSTYSTREQN